MYMCMYVRVSECVEKGVCVCASEKERVRVCESREGREKVCECVRVVESMTVCYCNG